MNFFDRVFGKKPAPAEVAPPQPPAPVADPRVPPKEGPHVALTKAPPIQQVDPTKVNRDYSLLHPLLVAKLQVALEACHEQGLMIYVFEGTRTFERQELLYAQGRTAHGNIVTNAKPGDSWHNYGLAVDLVFDGDSRDGIQWSWSGSYKNPKLDPAKKNQYLAAAEIMEAHGFEWAGRWVKMKEAAHFQITGGLSLKELKALQETGGIDLVWKTVTSRVS